MPRNKKQDMSYFTLDIAGLAVPTAFQYLKQSRAKNRFPLTTGMKVALLIGAQTRGILKPSDNWF